jgi:hypothetical protein
MPTLNDLLNTENGGNMVISDTILQIDNFLSIDECSGIADDVIGLRDILLLRDGFFTLGAAVYLDDPRVYSTLARLINPYISKYFDELIGKVGSYFETETGLPPVFFDNIALPGFHIFDHNASNLQGYAHQDTPHLNLFSGTDYSRPFTFTLPVRLPRLGGGLNTWPDSDVTKHTDPKELPPPVYFPYTTGTLYIHDGLMLHQVANNVPIEVDDMRITLQGHGVCFSDSFTLFF